MPELPTSEIDDTTDRISGLYAGLTVKGPISPRVFYTLYGLARTGRYFADDSADAATYSLLAGASGASIRAYAPRLGKSRAELQAMYASGDGGFVRFSPAESGTATFFAPITPAGLGQFAPVAFSNVFLTRFAYSVQPWDLGAGPREGLRTELSIAAVYRPSTGTGTFDGLSADTEAGYAGTEAGATVEYRPFSDLRMMVESVLFFPASLLVDGGVAANTDAQSLVSAMIELSF
jgi:hypothetical protein